MTEQERETAGAVRSAHVAHFFPPDWAQTAQRASGSLERVDRALAAPQLLVTVPDAAAVLAVAREMRAVPASAGLRVLPVTGAARAARLLKASPPHIIIGVPTVLAELLASSALKLDAVQGVVLAAADEYDAQLEPLAALLAEIPRGASHLLTAAAPTPLVDNLLERYMHRARRVTAPAPIPVAIAPGTPPTIYVRTVTTLSPLASLAEVLDDLDPPSAALVVVDARTEAQARTALEGLGYATDSGLITVTQRDVALHTALVLFLGLPDQHALAAALDAHPARLVALIGARQRETFRAMAKGAVLMPYENSRAARAARAREDTLRGALRTTLAAGLPAREIAALEPLLAEHDGLEIAGAALRMYEQAAAKAAGAHLAGREEAYNEVRAAKAAQKKDEVAAAPRPPRSFDRPKSGARGSERSRPPREDRGFDRPRPPREGGFDRARPPRDAAGARSGPPRRDDRPRPPRRDK